MVKYLGREVTVLREAKMGDPNWGTSDDMLLIDYEGDKLAVSPLVLEDYHPEIKVEKKRKAH